MLLIKQLNGLFLLLGNHRILDRLALQTVLAQQMAAGDRMLPLLCRQLSYALPSLGTCCSRFYIYYLTQD